MASRWIESPLGAMVLEANAQGLTSLRWASRPGRDRDGGPDETGHLDAGQRYLEAYFSGRELPPLPVLAPAGTAFQKRVWGALLGIPRGATASYAEIARLVASEGASRAVGQANGRNPLPVIVPCHRVVASGGQLGGFSAGLDRKRWLLAHEGVRLRESYAEA